MPALFIRRVILMWGLLAPLPAQQPSGAAPQPPSAAGYLFSMVAIGTVGPYPIGLNFTTRNHTELVAAHYFYISQRKDIPLTGGVQGSTVTWTGTDGGTFHLHFAGYRRKGAPPLTFYTAIGLEGTWTQGTRTLPVSLNFDHGTTNPGERLYASVTDQSDADFEAMIATVQHAILTHDTATLAAHTHFPVRVNGAHPPLTLRTPADLDRNWSRIFPAPILARVKADIPHEMFLRNGQAMLGDGELWFDGKGLVAINLIH